MAGWHLYSRVPAKASMYNKSDGYDTFAKSASVSKKYIDNVLLKAIDIKLDKNDTDMIVNGKLQPVYCVFWDPDGRMVQTRFSFLPSDYTGERTSYLASSLVLDEKETEAMNNIEGFALINPSTFVYSMDDFDIMSGDFSPIDTLPDGSVNAEPCQAIDEFINEQSPYVIKSIIYAMLTSAFSRSSCVYISVNDVPTEQFSEVAVGIINRLYQLFPGCIKNKLPVVSFTTDYSKFPAAKVKFVTREHLSDAVGKGFVFDMTPAVISGIKDKEYNEYESEVTFLYNTAGYSEEYRRSFNVFINRACSLWQNTKLNMKTFSELVLIYRQISGETPHEELLQNDARMYDYLLAYEKHRAVMSESDRLKVYSPFERYPKKRLLIPGNVFSKLCKLYRDELPENKVAIMGYVLDLMHTDVMRDKLFAFIDSVYDSETPGQRALICQDLARVFYGGFLQEKILSLYSRGVSSLDPESVDAIIQKLTLSIRTEAVQDSVLSFVEDHFECFSRDQRDSVYASLAGTLKENDRLSIKAIKCLGKIIVKDDIERPAVVDEIYAALAENKELFDAVFGYYATEYPGCEAPRLLVLLTETAVAGGDNDFFERQIGFLAGNGTNGAVLTLSNVQPSAGKLSKANCAVLAERLTRTVIDGISSERLSTIIKNHRVMKAITTEPANFAAFYGNVYAYVIKPYIINNYEKAIEIRGNSLTLEDYVLFAEGMDEADKGEKVKYTLCAASIISYLKSGQPRDALKLFVIMERIPETDPFLLARIKDAGEQYVQMPGENAPFTLLRDKYTAYLSIVALFDDDPAEYFYENCLPICEAELSVLPEYASAKKEKDKAERARKETLEETIRLLNTCKISGKYNKTPVYATMCRSCNDILLRIKKDISRSDKSVIKTKLDQLCAGVEMTPPSGTESGEAGKTKERRSFISKLFSGK